MQKFRLRRIAIACSVATIAGGSLLGAGQSAWAAGPRARIGGGVFDVTNYGAHGDGVGDNSASFKRAIGAAQLSGGGTVSVPSGIYTFAGGTPASIQIHGTVPITLAGAGRDSTTLVETTPGRKDLLSVRVDHTVIQDLTLDTQTHDSGHGLGVGANNTTVQRIRVVSGTQTFGIYYPGPPGAHPGNPAHSEGNVVNDLI